MSRARRRQHVPWNAAGRASETQGDGDSVVRDTGWVFNNETGQQLTLAEFVNSGEQEVGAYLQYFGFLPEENAQRSLVEIGAGIGRMTAGFTQRFKSVVACDLDAAFLERCRETVGKFGVPERLSTSHVADGKTLALPDASADMVFSYITLQHCESADALALTEEALRHLNENLEERVAQRTQALLAMTAGGMGMTAIVDDPALFDAPFLCENTTLSAINFERHFVVSAAPAVLDSVEAELRARGVVHQRLAVQYAFHSPWIDPARDDVQALLGALPVVDGRIPMACCASRRGNPETRWSPIATASPSRPSTRMTPRPSGPPYSAIGGSCSRTSGSRGISGGVGKVSSRYSQMARDWVRTVPSSRIRLGTSPCGLTARYSVDSCSPLRK